MNTQLRNAIIRGERVRATMLLSNRFDNER